MHTECVNEIAEIRQTPSERGFLLAGNSKEARQKLVKAGIDFGLDKFVRCINSGNTNLVKLFLDAGIDVNGKLDRYFEWTPLHKAAETGTAEILKILLDNNADVKARNYGGWTPLHSAAFGNNKGTALLLLDRGGVLNAGDNDGNTPLHIAAEKNSRDAILLLIDRKADINAKNKSGRTPLHIAAFKNNTDAALILTEHGADVNAKDTVGNLPLHYAAGELDHAAANNAEDIVRLLIKKGSAVNDGNNSGTTPLMLTFGLTRNYNIIYLNFNVARCLIEHGADVNAKDNRGNSALMKTFTDPGFIDMFCELIKCDIKNKSDRKYDLRLLDYVVYNHHKFSDKAERAQIIDHIVKHTDLCYCAKFVYIVDISEP